jgi:hypothetical protein
MHHVDKLNREHMIPSGESSTDFSVDSAADLVVSSGSSLQHDHVPPPAVGVQTTLQKCIKIRKKYTDGTVRYAFLTTTGEPKMTRFSLMKIGNMP